MALSQGACGLAAAGREGGGGCALAFRGGSVATPALASLSGREGGGSGVPWCCQGACGLAVAGRKGGTGRAHLHGGVAVDATTVLPSS